MKITKQARRDAKELFQHCLVNGQLDEARVRQVIDLVATKKPRGYNGILKHLQRLVRLEVEKRTARIESAVALTPEMQQQVQGNLTRLHGPGLIFEHRHNPALIGGMRIRVGSDVYDGSVQSRIEQLNEKF